MEEKYGDWSDCVNGVDMENEGVIWEKGCLSWCGVCCLGCS